MRGSAAQERVGAGRWGGSPRSVTFRRIGATHVLIPVKSFRQAKVRLAPALSEPERVELARTMATRVLVAAQSLPVSVVCDDRDVADWSEAKGAPVVWRPRVGLNGV